ncbi:MAG: hypothetical protein GEV09_13590 [Pseudonocardiaceae bacterium]|nr:hypothetical protein [Pseudonocardiaceae bacterium]
MDRPDHTAHFRPTRSQQPAEVTILDDRGVPTVELELPTDVGTAGDAERHLSDAGWTVTASWTATDDGWTAPVSR